MLRSGYTAAIQRVRSGGRRIRCPRWLWAMEWIGGQRGLQEIQYRKEGRKMFNRSRFDTGLRSRGYGEPQLLFIKKQKATKEGETTSSKKKWQRRLGGPSKWVHTWHMREKQLLGSRPWVAMGSLGYQGMLQQYFMPFPLPFSAHIRRKVTWRNSRDSQ